MPNYYVDDGGNNSDGSSWANAYTSLSALDDAVTLASGDVIYIGHDHVCQYTHAGNRIITGPTSGLPVIIISTTQGSNPVSYQKSTSNQIDTSEGSYYLRFDGSFALYGICMLSGAQIELFAEYDESFYSEDCTFKVAANTTLSLSGTMSIVNPIIDLTADGTTGRSVAVITSADSSLLTIINPSFVNAAYRTGAVFYAGQGYNFGNTYCYGGDFSGFTNATTCELINTTNASIFILDHVKTADTWTAFSGTPASTVGYSVISNSGSSDTAAKGQFAYRFYAGDIVSSQSIYRSGGAEIDGDNIGWLVTTTSTCSIDYTFNTPYMLASVASTGNTTFDVYITNDTADFTDEEVWIEVLYLGTSSESNFSSASDRKANRLSSAAAQTDDTGSTWNGSGPSFTYKQKLSVTTAVNAVGCCMVRICVGVASINSSRYFYVDPCVFINGSRAGYSYVVPTLGVQHYSSSVGSLLSHPGMTGGCNG